MLCLNTFLVGYNGETLQKSSTKHSKALIVEFFSLSTRDQSHCRTSTILLRLQERHGNAGVLKQQNTGPFICIHPIRWISTILRFSLGSELSHISTTFGNCGTPKISMGDLGCAPASMTSWLRKSANYLPPQGWRTCPGYPYHDWHRRLEQERKVLFQKEDQTSERIQGLFTSVQFYHVLPSESWIDHHISTYLRAFGYNHTVSVRFKSQSVNLGILPCAPLVPPVAQIQRSQIRPHLAPLLGAGPMGAYDPAATQISSPNSS